MRLLVKSGKVPTHPDSYRPIFPLKIWGKFFKRDIMRRQQVYLESEVIYSPAQYNFRRGKGTGHTIAVATETAAIEV